MRRWFVATVLCGLAWCAWAMPPAIFGIGQGWQTVSPPSGFTVPLPFAVQTKGGVFRAWDTALNKEYDPADYRPAETKTYYVQLTGDDGDQGTEAQPLATLATALGKADVTCVRFLDAGPYASYPTVVSKSVSIIGHGTGTVIHGWYVGLGWALVGGRTNTYTVSQADAGNWAFDTTATDARGDYERLMIQTTVDAVEANPGSVFIDGSDIYVHTRDSRAADADIRIPITTAATGVISMQTSSRNYYLENLHIYGGRYGVYYRTNDFTSTGAMKNCVLKYAHEDILYLRRGVRWVSHSSTAARGRTDAFNYTGGALGQFLGVEIGCTGRDSGNSSSDNGSTGHEESNVVMIGGEYMRNVGRNVAHITASKLWALGVNSHDSAATSSTYDENWSAQSAGTVFWLHGCTSSGSTTDIRADGDGVVYLRQWRGGTTYIGTPVAY